MSDGPFKNEVNESDNNNDDDDQRLLKFDSKTCISSCMNEQEFKIENEGFDGKVVNSLLDPKTGKSLDISCGEASELKEKDRYATFYTVPNHLKSVESISGVEKEDGTLSIPHELMEEKSINKGKLDALLLRDINRKTNNTSYSGKSIGSYNEMLSPTVATSDETIVASNVVIKDSKLSNQDRFVPQQYTRTDEEDILAPEVEEYQQPGKNAKPLSSSCFALIIGTISLILLSISGYVVFNFVSNVVKSKNDISRRNNMTELQQYMDTIISNLDINPAVFANDISDQSRSKDWILYHDKYKWLTINKSMTELSVKQMQSLKDHIIQRYSLTVLYYAMGGNQVTKQHLLNNFDGWIQPTHECIRQSNQSWAGLHCDSNNKVQTLWFDSNNGNFIGTIPPEIGLLSSLQYISIEGNIQLTGSLPDSMMKLSSLKYLSLSNNHITGTLPSNIFTYLLHLEYFNVEANEIEGTIPVSLQRTTTLNTLLLQNNQMNGTIPWETICRSTNIEYINLQNNHFSGASKLLPINDSNCPKLHYLYI